MDILNQIIAHMNKEQVRGYKLFVNRTNEKDDRKDILYFDYVRKNGDGYDESKIHEKLYGGSDKNTFYRLKNRVLSDVSKSLMVQHFDDDELIYALHLLALEKFYFNRNQIRIAYYFLKKAEVEAKRIENFELLDIIYGEYIRLSREMMTINPEHYILLRTSNQEQIKQLRAIDDILATVTFRLKATQNFSSSENPVLKLLQKTVRDLSADKELHRSPKLRFKIYDAVTQILLQKRQYPALEEYLLSMYTDFVKEKLFNKNNHDTKLQLLVFIVNTLFKTDKLNDSLKYADKLKSAMEEHHRLHYDKYLFFYYNSLVINYSRLDRNKAIDILMEMKGDEKICANNFYELFIYLNLAVVYFDKKDFHQSIRNLHKIYLLEGYKTADKSLQFKIAIADLMVRYELDDEDTLEYKLKQVKKDFRTLLLQKNYIREKEMIEIISKMMRSTNIKGDKILVKKIQSLLKEGEASDTEIIHYRNWLKEKI
ncbi:MAG: hypothetical protein ABI763_07255 [Bacteroidota bacterium]